MLGTTEDDAKLSLDLLDQAVQAFRSNIVDDVHVGNKFADLLETLSSRVKLSFVRMAAKPDTGASRGASRSPAPQGTNPNSMNRTPRPFGDSLGLTGSHWNGHNASMHSTPTMAPAHMPNYPQYEANNSNYSIMQPPPPSSMHDFGNNFASDANGFSDNTSYPDWLALPLDPLLYNTGMDVTQTTYGPDVGGFDLLDLLLNNGADGSGSGN